MKLALDKIKITPKSLPFGFCIYGALNPEIKAWVDYWNLQIEHMGNYTNIFPQPDTKISDLFLEPKQFEYGDFFSPNLNKHLHLGHLSNLIIAKSLQSLGVAKKTIAILGDTLEGAVSKEEALTKYKEYCSQFGYNIDDLYFASEQVLQKDLLIDGVGDYAGTKVFEIGEAKMVGIKSSGATTYFYQDVALAEKLNAPTLYLTGLEQNGHFDALNKLYPNVKHIGLGLVTVDGKKMSSSTGTVIMMDDILSTVNSKFNDDKELAWNVLCGHILKYDLPSMKDINMAQIDNVKTSFGLYLSYTLARLKSAGMKPETTVAFNSHSLQFKLIKAKYALSPSVLFDEVVEHAKKINTLYIGNHIKDNEGNQKMFQPLLNDLSLGMSLLGMFNIDKV
jgi:arginyl-tRNA synthetase